MKYYRYLFISFLALSANAYALDSKIEVVEQFDNLRMISFISMKDISRSPEWNPDMGAPPLSVSEAIQAVRDFSKNPATSMQVKEIEIRPVPKHENHWHYLIKIANDTKTTRYDVYVVLMNKKVIPAIIEPQGYK